MEINISRFFQDADAFEFSASVAERGMNAGPETWNNAKQEAVNAPLLCTEEALQAMRDWARATGAWDDEEIAAWSDVELNALFIQLVSGDMREAGMDAAFPDEFDWSAYEQAAQAGQISGNIFQGIDGHVYYYLGS